MALHASVSAICGNWWNQTSMHFNLLIRKCLLEGICEWLVLQSNGIMLGLNQPNSHESWPCFFLIENQQITLNKRNFTQPIFRVNLLYLSHPWALRQVLCQNPHSQPASTCRSFSRSVAADDVDEHIIMVHSAGKNSKSCWDFLSRWAPTWNK